MEKQEIFNLLRNNDKICCLQTLRHLATTDAISTTSVLLDALTEADKHLRERSAWALSLLPLRESPDVVNIFCDLLRNDPSDKMRLCCAIGLMRTKTIQVRDTYIQALKDKNEKVAMIACAQLGFRDGKESSVALFGTLSHPSWRIRLEACKSLITLKAADKRVVFSLEKMAQEQEAKVYNAEIDQISSPLFDVEMWGKLETITEQARQIAASKLPPN